MDEIEFLATCAARGRAVSVFGAFNSRTLVELPTDLATRLVGKPLRDAGRTNVIEAVERDLEKVRELSPELADSSFAATALQLAYELEHPYNSATSKSMCARSLMDALDRLRELTPEAEKGDGLDDLSSRRAARLAGGTAAAN